MNCSREDFDLVMRAISSAIADGRQLNDSCEQEDSGEQAQRLVEACGRISAATSPAFLHAIGNYTLLCLVRADIAAMKAQAEIRKLMDR